MNEIIKELMKHAGTDTSGLCGTTIGLCGTITGLCGTTIGLCL
jgi:hypothetical protein